MCVKHKASRWYAARQSNSSDPLPSIEFLSSSPNVLWFQLDPLHKSNKFMQHIIFYITNRRLIEGTIFSYVSFLQDINFNIFVCTGARHVPFLKWRGFDTPVLRRCKLTLLLMVVCHLQDKVFRYLGTFGRWKMY